MRSRTRTIEIDGPLETCPTCGHAHPGGLGLALCFCGDCSLLFGPLKYEHLAPAYQDRLRELRRMMP